MRSANYPRPAPPAVNDANYPRPPTTNQFAQAAQAVLPPVAPTTVFDDSIFDNSMMISEEDLICDENFANDSDLNVYPILPFKRK